MFERKKLIDYGSGDDTTCFLYQQGDKYIVREGVDEWDFHQDEEGAREFFDWLLAGRPVGKKKEERK